jgi:alpha-L-fucosidase 2
LWDCTGAPKSEGDFTYASLKRFVAEKDQKKISATFDDPYNRPTPTKLPAGKIVIDLHEKSNVSSFLDLSSAQATVTAGKITLQSFIHATGKVGFIRVNSAVCDFAIENPQYGKPLKTNRPAKSRPGLTQSLKNLHYEPAKKTGTVRDGISIQYFTQKVSEKLTYGIFLGMRKTGASTVAAYTVGTGKDEDAITQGSINLLCEALEKGYAKNFETHKAWWQRFWDKSFVELEDKFLEKNWYLGNYLLGSCSRKGSYPMPLQGVWTADDGQLPPWKGDYHHDLNTELCYYSYLKANHIDEGASFVDYLLSLTDKAKEFARDFFGADGLCLPSVMDIEGNALAGWVMYAISPTNQLWLCRAVEKHYDYTGDKDFLETSAYPFIKSSGDFVISLLRENKDGKLVLPLSSSPEIHDNTLKAWLTPNTNYDLALIRAHFISLIKLSVILDLPEDTGKWQTALDKLDDLHLDSDHVLLLSRDERLKESHRHIAHLMAVHPLRLIEYDSAENQAIIDASLKDLEALSTDYFCGYSFAWLAELYCVQKNGEKARRTLDIFWKYFCSPNGFHLNGDYLDKGYSKFKYRPFTLEGNFCAVDALQEMLLYSENGKITLCPAIPKSWQNLSFNLRAENGVLVTAQMKNGKVVHLKLFAECETSFTLEGLNDKPLELHLNKGESVELNS